MLAIVGHEICRWTGERTSSAPVGKVGKGLLRQSLLRRTWTNAVIKETAWRTVVTNFSLQVSTSPPFKYCPLIFVESSLKLPNDANSCKLVATQLTQVVNFYRYWLSCQCISCQQAQQGADHSKLIVRKCWSWLLESASGWVNDLHRYPAPPHTTPLTPHKPRPVDAKLLHIFAILQFCIFAFCILHFDWVTFMGILPPPSHHLHPTSHALLMQNFCNTLWSRWWLVVVTMQLKTCNFQHFCKLIVFMKMLIFIGFMRYLNTKLQHVHVAILICWKSMFAICETSIRSMGCVCISEGYRQFQCLV